MRTFVVLYTLGGVQAVFVADEHADVEKMAGEYLPTIREATAGTSLEVSWTRQDCLHH